MRPISANNYKFERLSNHDQAGSWLIRIRWAAVVGQLLVFFAACWMWNLDLARAPLIVITTLVIISNIGLTLPVARSWLARRAVQGGVLIMDIVLLTALLYSYGGHTNPFSMVYLVHVVLAALLLNAEWTWSLSVLCSICYAALFRWYVPIQALSISHMHASESEFSLHLQGMLVGFVLIAFLVCAFLQRMRTEIDWREQELQRIRTNEEKLAVVTTISASVAHELGTPLATMTLIVEDLKQESRSYAAVSRFEKDVDQLQLQLERCSSALIRFGQDSGGLFGEMPQDFSIVDIFESLKIDLLEKDFGRVSVEKSSQLELVKLPKEGLRHVICALIKNALEASPCGGDVRAFVQTTRNSLFLTVADSGKGMTVEELKRVGEPFFTTKDSSRGMGLGLFITRLFTERLGGTFRIESKLGEGTKVLLSLPRILNWSALA